MFDNSSPYSFAKKQTKILSSKGIPVWFNVGNKPKMVFKQLKSKKNRQYNEQKKKRQLNTLYKSQN